MLSGRGRDTLLMVSKHVGVVPDVGWVVKCGQTASWTQPMRGCTGPAPTRSRSLSGALDCPKGVFLILDRPMSPDVPSNPPWTRAAPISARTGSNEDNGVVFLASSMSTRLCTMTCRKEVGIVRRASGLGMRVARRVPRSEAREARHFDALIRFFRRFTSTPEPPSGPGSRPCKAGTASAHR